MAPGSELSHAAFGFGASAFSLAGIHLEEIFGVRLKVLQVDPMVLRFCLIVVGISGFRGLAKTIGARSVTDNAATAGICRPGDDRPCRSGTLDPRAISNLNRLRLWRVFWRRRGGSSQSRC